MEPVRVVGRLALRAGRGIASAIPVLTALAVLLPVAVLVVTAWTNGWQLAGVRTHSMEPTYARGSLMVVKPVEPSAVRAGMVVGFVDPRTDLFVAHRVTEVMPATQGAGFLFTTKGDANRVEDGIPVPARNLRGRVAWAVPGLGFVTEWLAWPRGFLLISVPALVLLAGGEAARFHRRRRARTSACPHCHRALAGSAGQHAV